MHQRRATPTRAKFNRIEVVIFELLLINSVKKYEKRYFLWKNEFVYETKYLGMDIVRRGVKTPHFKNNPPPIWGNPLFLKIPDPLPPSPHFQGKIFKWPKIL